MTITRKLTAEQFARLPAYNHNREELIRGTLTVLDPGPGYTHGSVAARIGYLLLAFVTPRRLCAVVHRSGFVFERNPDTVCGPDLSFIDASRLPLPEGIAYLDGAPDLAVEILSPGNKKKDMAERIALFLRKGTRLMWVVDPKRRTVTVHRPESESFVLSIDDQLSGQDVLPGFECRVADFFDELR
ncbi:MAG TPA: Uma2 family endonuclease [Gemmatimonadaceae bacterium]|jgi:Uma2 family endonuclease|nr:Uma2 family endonuclease [Gemmatimonadaceae bacterium]